MDFAERLKTMLYRTTPEVPELDHLPGDWQLRDMIVEIVELPSAVNGMMKVKVVWREGLFVKEERDRLWTMRLTVRIASCLDKLIDKYTIVDRTKLHGAQLTIKHYGHKECRRHRDISAELKGENDV